MSARDSTWATFGDETFRELSKTLNRMTQVELPEKLTYLDKEYRSLIHRHVFDSSRFSMSENMYGRELTLEAGRVSIRGVRVPFDLEKPIFLNRVHQRKSSKAGGGAGRCGGLLAI